jgi:Chaperone of endosialidase
VIDFPANPTLGDAFQSGQTVYKCVGVNPAVWSATIATGGVPEAPSDGKQYTRRNAAWSVIDKTTLGLGNVDNTSDANKPISTATATALAGKEPAFAAGTAAQYRRGDKTWQALDKAAVGLGNVDNTSDVNKPASTPQMAVFVQKIGDTMTGGLAATSFTVKGDFASIQYQKASGASNGYVSGTANQIGFLNAAGSNWNFWSDDAGNVNARASVTGTALVSNGGSIRMQGWGGNPAAGVAYFGNANNYLFFDGSTFTFSGGNAVNASSPFHATVTGLQFYATAANWGNAWQFGMDGVGAYCVYANGGTGVFLTWGGTAWMANSDERLKTITGEITGAIDKIKQVRSVRYTWKEGVWDASVDTQKSRVGFIAQDIQKIQPESVTTNEAGKLAVAYSELVPLAFAAIKELAIRIEPAANELLINNIVNSTVDATRIIKSIRMIASDFGSVHSSVGFSAQNLQSIDAALTLDNLDVNIPTMVAYLAKALQEALVRIDALEARP